MSPRPLSGLFALIVSSFIRVIEDLADLAAVIPLYLVRNCNDWYMEAFLDHSGTRHLFADAVCHGTTGLPKHENLRNLMARDGLQRGYYVGDTNGDRTRCGDGRTRLRACRIWVWRGRCAIGHPVQGLCGHRELVKRQAAGLTALRKPVERQLQCKPNRTGIRAN